MAEVQKGKFNDISPHEKLVLPADALWSEIELVGVCVCVCVLVCVLVCVCVCVCVCVFVCVLEGLQ